MHTASDQLMTWLNALAGPPALAYAHRERSLGELNMREDDPLSHAAQQA